MNQRHAPHESRHATSFGIWLLQSCNWDVIECLDEGYPSARKRQTGGIGSSSMALCMRVVICEPIRLHIHDLIVKNTCPVVDETGVGLKVKLDAIDRPGETECLVRSFGAPGEVHRAFRKRESIAVPVKNRKLPGYSGKDWIGGSLISAGHFVPAEFDRTTQNIFGAVAAGDKLTAETNPEHSLAGIAEALDKSCQCRKIGVGIVGKGILIAAKYDQRMMTRIALRQDFAKVGLTQVYCSGCFFQCAADLAETRILIILNDENPHTACLMIATIGVLR